MGPYPRTKRGKQYLLVVTDAFSRWIEAYPLGNATTKKIIQCLEEDFFPRWGYSRAILSDNGPQFTSRQWEESCLRWQTALWTTPTYHPRANPTERRNQDIKKLLRTHLEGGSHNRWDEFVPTLLFTLRNRQNAATGFSPSRALTGRGLLRPGEWHHSPPTYSSEASQRVHSIVENQATYIQKTQIPEKIAFKVGDLIFLRNHNLSKASDQYCAGLAPAWEGPYPIHAHLGGNVYHVARGQQLTKVHASQMKAYVGQPVQTAVPDKRPFITAPTVQPVLLEERQPVFQEERQHAAPSVFQRKRSSHPAFQEGRYPQPAL